MNSGKNMIKVNITNDNLDGNYDYHCPIPLLLHANPGQTDASDAQTVAAFTKVPKDKPIILVGKGDPAMLAEQSAMALQKHGWQDVRVDYTKNLSRYYNKLKAWDNLKRPWFHVDGSQFVKDIKKFFDVYDRVEKVPDYPKNGICGHYPRGRKTRTEINLGYNIDQSPNRDLMSEMRKLFDQIAPFFLDVLANNGLDFTSEPERVTLRMVEYDTNGTDIDYHSHVDTSTVTMLLYEDAPGLHVREFTDDDYTFGNTQVIDASKYSSIGTGTIIPGYLICDEFNSWTPSTWHGVHIHSGIGRRRSIVVRIEPKDVEKQMAERS
jgi:hypothetical protein